MTIQKNRPNGTVLMKGHKICFMKKTQRDGSNEGSQDMFYEKKKKKNNYEDYLLIK